MAPYHVVLVHFPIALFMTATLAILWRSVSGGPVAKAADIAIVVPAQKTARIQESHITLFHALCEVVEDEFAK